MWIESDDIRVGVEARGRGEFLVRVSTARAEEMREALQEAGLEPQRRHEFALLPDGVVWVVMAVASPTAVVAGLRAFWHRNDKKRVEVSPEGGVTAQGYSVDELENLTPALERLQAREDEDVRRVLGAPPVDETD